MNLGYVRYTNALAKPKRELLGRVVQSPIKLAQDERES